MSVAWPPLKAGTHAIEIKYTPQGLPMGIFITATTLLICGIYVAKGFWKQSRGLIAACMVCLPSKKK